MGTVTNVVPVAARPLTRLAVCLTWAAVVGACASPQPREAGSDLRIAITMDDLPVHGGLPEGETRTDVSERIVAAFRAAGVPEVYGFINASGVEGDADQEGALRAWVAAGYPLGNHTWSHRNLNQLSVAEFAAEIDRNEEALRRIEGAGDWKWFRYPFLAEGNDPAKRDSVRALLAERGYRIAAVTTSFSDYEWNDAYQRCRASGDAAGLAALEEGYLQAVRESIQRARELSQRVHERDVPHVLLTHISPFNARMMPRVLQQYREAGFTFVTLEEAQRDPLFEGDMDPMRTAPPTDLGRQARERGIEIPRGTDRRALLAEACR